MKGSTKFWLVVIVILLILAAIAYYIYTAVKKISFGQVGYNNVNWQSAVDSFLSLGSVPGTLDVDFTVNNNNDFPLKATNVVAELYNFDNVLLAKTTNPVTLEIPANAINYIVKIPVQIFLNSSAIVAIQNIITNKASNIKYIIKGRAFNIIPITYTDKI